MKYNKSEIMKSAWSLYYMSKRWVDSLTFSECLRRAWVRVKAERKAAELEAAKPVFDGTAEMDGYTFNLWEKYGKRRIYINNCTGHNKSNRGGYIDLDNGNSVVAAGCVKTAAYNFLAAYRIA